MQALLSGDESKEPLAIRDDNGMTPLASAGSDRELWNQEISAQVVQEMLKRRAKSLAGSGNERLEHARLSATLRSGDAAVALLQASWDAGSGTSGQGSVPLKAARWQALTPATPIKKVKRSPPMQTTTLVFLFMYSRRVRDDR